MAQKFVAVPSVYPKLLELRKSKKATLKKNKYLKETTKLRYYQVIGSLHMIMLSRMVLGDGTGLGKSLENIAAYTWLLEKDPTLKWLIVCQKSAMYQWAEELDKFTQGITYRVISNEQKGVSNRQARQEHYTAFSENVMIINYNPILEEYEQIKEILGSNYMICWDECIAFKNRKTKTHFAAEQLSGSAQRVYGLSATIIKNGLEEVYGIYNVVVPGLFGRITHFRKAYCVQKKMRLKIKGKIRKIPKTIGYKNLKKFKDTIDPYFLIRRKKDVASELPQLISKQAVLEMSDEQSDLYRDALNGIVYEEKIKQEYYELLDIIRQNENIDEKTMNQYNELKKKYDQFSTEDGKRKGKLAALTYCQMVSNGPGLIKAEGRSSKEEEFIRIMTEELSTEKVILFTRFKRGIPFLEIQCERNKIDYAKITGDQSSKERDIARQRFQTDPNCNLIFITTAGSSSLNLQAASTIIFYDTPWSYGDLVQTIGRAQRIGSLQEHIVLIHFVNKNTIDAKVLKRVSEKKNLSDEILGNTSEGALDFTKNDENMIDDLFEDLLKDLNKK